jgi:hypothetical protein
LGFDRVALRLARRLRKRGCCNCEYRGRDLNKSFVVAGSRRFNRSEISNAPFGKNRDASFSLSGSAASGLLLFSWGGGKPVFE